MRTLIVSTTLAVLFAGCPNERDDDDDDRVPGPFGSVTTIVVLVNPVINEGSATDVESGAQRDGVLVEVEDSVPTLTATTNDDGIAVLSGVPVGTNVLRIGDGSLAVEVIAERELYDVVVSVDRADVTLVLPIVRYPIGGDVHFVRPGDSIGDVLGDDGAIVVLDAGEYGEDLEVRGEGVLLFGSGAAADAIASTIDGDVQWLGGNGRMRGVAVAGTLTASANGFSAAFCELGSANITGNGVSLIHNAFDGNATVPSTNAVLVDNIGIP